MAKVKCAICKNYEGGKCIEKDEAVKPNKPRKCELFLIDESRIKEKTPIPTMRGVAKEIWPEKKKEIKAQMKRAVEEAERDKSNLEDKRKYMGPRTDHEKHPLTGDLSRFSTTAPK